MTEVVNPDVLHARSFRERSKRLADVRSRSEPSATLMVRRFGKCSVVVWLMLMKRSVGRQW